MKPKLPIKVGKAQQQLSQAIICGDDDLARWLDWAVKNGQVKGDPRQIRNLRQRLDNVMEPLDEA